MHPALPLSHDPPPDLGQHVLIERLGDDGVWVAYLYNRVRRPGDGLLDLEREPVREWRSETMNGVVEAVEADVPGVSMLVLVEG